MGGACRATATSPPGWCCATGGCGSRRRPTRSPTRMLVLRVAVAAATGGRPHRPRLARPAGRPDAGRTDPVDRGGPPAVRRAAAGRPAGHRRHRDARPARAVRAHPPRVGAGAQPSRSATPTTASPSTGTCARRRPTPSALTDRVERPDLLVVGALLHDIGKGYPGDHTEVGIEVVGQVADRMGFPPEESAQLQDMVRHHLLLPDVAIRRDLSDDGTIRWVANQVGSLSTLGLLDALTEADSIATGPAAWSSWKAELLGQLVERTRHVLGGGAVEEVTGDRAPSEELLAKMAEGRRILEGSDDQLVVISPDRPGLFSRVGGGARAQRARRPGGVGLLRRRRHGPRGVPGREQRRAHHQLAPDPASSWTRRSTGAWPSTRACGSGPGCTAGRRGWPIARRSPACCSTTSCRRWPP